MKLLMTGHIAATTPDSGPVRYSRAIAEQAFRHNDAIFCEYFADGRLYSRWQKLFGSSRTAPQTVQCGIVPFIFRLFRFRPDILHITQFERFALPAILLAPLLRYRLVYTCHGIVAHEDSLKTDVPTLLRLKNRFVEYLLLTRSHSVIAFSGVVSRLAEKTYPGLLIRWSFTVPGITHESDHSAGSLPAERQLLLMLGNHRQREHESLPAIELITRAFPEVPVTLVGFENAATLQERFPSVQFLSMQPPEQWHDLLTRTSVFLVPMRNETYSFAALEAMRAGVIVIADESSGIAGIIKHGVNGYLFRADEPSEIITILKQLSQDSAQLAQIRINAGTTVSGMSWEESFRQHLNVYRGSGLHQPGGVQ